MRECGHRTCEVEIGDGGGITRKTEPGQAGPRERGGYAVRQLALGAAAARRWRGCGEAHAPGQAGPRERGGYAVRVTRYGKPATRFGCSGRLLVNAVRGPRNSRSPPGVAGSLFPRGGSEGRGRRCDRHQGTGRAIVQEPLTQRLKFWIDSQAVGVTSTVSREILTHGRRIRA